MVAERTQALGHVAGRVDGFVRQQVAEAILVDRAVGTGDQDLQAAIRIEAKLPAKTVTAGIGVQQPPLAMPIKMDVPAVEMLRSWTLDCPADP